MIQHQHFISKNCTDVEPFSPTDVRCPSSVFPTRILLVKSMNSCTLQMRTITNYEREQHVFIRQTENSSASVQTNEQTSKQKNAGHRLLALF